MPAFEGIVEEIVFRNEENGWTVMSLKPDKGHAFTVVGVLPFLCEGESVRVEGEWVEHRDYGRQLRAEKYESIRPNGKNAVEKYLASGIISGVGPATAKLLIKRFGEKTLEIMEDEPWRLTEIEGIGVKRAQLITESFEKQKQSRALMVFLSGLGFTPPVALKIRKKYGDLAEEIIKSDPYRLADEVPGVGFQTADSIALSLGFSPNDERRLRSGVRYALTDAVSSGGHTYLPRETLVRESARLLGASREPIERAIVQLTLKGDVIQERACGDDAVYLRALYEAESDVAVRMMRLLAADSRDELPDETLDNEISRYEESESMRLSDLQRDAVKLAVNRCVTVITGGPGTGKTTLIKCLLCLSKRFGQTELCAPTGRAAKRMTEATGHEARTIHRMLEYSADEGTFKKCPEDPLKAKTVIVDETSMVDIFLMRSLLRALKPGTRLVLTGDADQLPSVGAGNVLGDLIASGEVPVVKLTEVFRQAEQSAIVTNAHRINRGEMPVSNRKGTDFYMERVGTAEQAAQSALNLVKTRLPGYFGFDALRDIQVMTPMKKGEAGVYAMNRRLQEALNPGNGKPQLSRGNDYFRPGDKVMQIKNDYDLEWTRDGEDGKGVFNGDIGFVTELDEEEKSLTVEFDDGRCAEYSAELLEELELAYCMSVHKSQGSEFQAVVIPLVSGPPMLLTRNLLYTAVTRARKLVVITGREDCVRAMVNNDHVAARYSSLRERLIAMRGIRG